MKRRCLAAACKTDLRSWLTPREGREKRSEEVCLGDKADLSLSRGVSEASTRPNRL